MVMPNDSGNMKDDCKTTHTNQSFVVIENAMDHQDNVTEPGTTRQKDDSFSESKNKSLIQESNKFDLLPESSSYKLNISSEDKNGKSTESNVNTAQPGCSKRHTFSESMHNSIVELIVKHKSKQISYEPIENISSPFSFTSINIELINTPSRNDSNNFQVSTSFALNYSETNLLVLYNRLLILLGWRSIRLPCFQFYCSAVVSILNWLYIGILVFLLLCGHLLQYASCYRQDNFSAYKFPIGTRQTKLPNSVTSPPTIHLKSTKQSSSTTDDWLKFSLDPVIHSTEFSIIPPTTISFLPKTTESYNFTPFKLFYLWKTTPPNNTTKEDSVEDQSDHRFFHSCSGNIATYYLIPSVLHMIAFLIMVYQLRNVENDRFYNLCVLNFIIITKISGREKASSYLRNSIRQYIFLGLFYCFVSVGINYFHLFFSDICFTFLQPSTKNGTLLIKILSLFSFVFIDVVYIGIFTTYALYCQLLIIFLHKNETAMREKRLSFQDFTKNIEEAKLCIDYLNFQNSISVSILVIHFVTRAVVVIIDLCTKRIFFQPDSFLLTVFSMFLWLSFVSWPLIQAARVTNACRSLAHIGHELRSRPFCFLKVAPVDLDSLLTYTSTLNLKARIMSIPVRTSCVTSIILIFIFTFIILAQANIIT